MLWWHSVLKAKNELPERCTTCPFKLSHRIVIKESLVLHGDLQGKRTDAAIGVYANVLNYEMDNHRSEENRCFACTIGFCRKHNVCKLDKRTPDFTVSSGISQAGVI